MNKKHTLFGLGMLGLGAVVTSITLPMTSANFSENAVRSPKPMTTALVTELTADQKAEIQTKHREKLTKELAEGKITQSEYDEMLTNLENLTFPMMGGNRGNFKFRGGMSGDFENFTEKRVDGMKASINLTDEQKTSVVSQISTLLETALTEGKITQEKYDELKKLVQKSDFSTTEVHLGKGDVHQRMFSDGDKIVD